MQKSIIVHRDKSIEYKQFKFVIISTMTQARFEQDYELLYLI